mgnify:CR=1 FL=1|jgi:hypothetical protein
MGEMPSLFKALTSGMCLSVAVLDYINGHKAWAVIMLILAVLNIASIFR